MVRVTLTRSDRERGERWGRLLREARAHRSIVDVAGAASISAETLRKIETGRIPTPTFFAVSALAEALGLSPDELVNAAAFARDRRPGGLTTHRPRRTIVPTVALLS